MPSEQRLHPATLLFDLAGHAKRFAVPALLVIFGMAQSTGGIAGRWGRLPNGWEVWLLVLFIPAALASVARYLSFRIRYDEHELVIRSGLLFRNERHVPFARIQNVDAVQNLFHRLLHVVEVRLETGGGSEEEAKLSVLPIAALDELRGRVFKDRTPTSEAVHSDDATHTETAAEGEALLHLPIRELLLCGILENKGMVLVAAAFGGLWESGIAPRVWNLFFETSVINRGLFRDFIAPFTEGGPFPFLRLAIAGGALAVLLLAVRVISMIWAFVRLYDFRLTKINEDLRTEYGLFTKVTATVPLRRVQAITIRMSPLHRWLKRATVQVATAGGAGGGQQSATNAREWLAPLIREEALPQLVQHVVPGFDFSAVRWLPVHPRAFARAVKPMLIISAIVTLATAIVIGWFAIGLLLLMLLWSIVTTRQYVAHLAWAEDDVAVLTRSGWLWKQITLARVNKIQAVAMHQSPFDRRAAMARVRVDTAGAGEFSHRVDIPYLDDQMAHGLLRRLSARAAQTAFRI
jgi:putative membrane protein